jgi:allantoin racemase
VRVLVINPNSSAGVTARIAAAAQAAARPGEQVRTIAATGAPELIVTPQDTALAEDAVLAAVDRQGGDVDGIVLASFGDTGLARVRQRVSVPVVGIARAALAVAGAVGERFAMVTFAPEMLPGLHQSVTAAGLSDRLAGMHAVEGWRWSAPGAIQDELFEPLRAHCLLAVQGGGVGSIVLGGGPLAGLAARLQPGLPVSVIDGTTAALGLLRLIARPPAAARPTGSGSPRPAVIAPP